MSPSEWKESSVGKTCRRQTTEERFWSKVDIRGEDECWPWEGKSVDKEGRGRFKFFLGPHSMINSQRAAWFCCYGELPSEVHVLHSCDHPPCCNPKHLFTGSHADNMADKEAKGRAGHRAYVLTPAEVLLVEKVAMPQYYLAQLFEVSEMVISRVKNGAYHVSY